MSTTGIGLENRYEGNFIVGSNHTLSATQAALYAKASIWACELGKEQMEVSSLSHWYKNNKLYGLLVAVVLVAAFLVWWNPFGSPGYQRAREVTTSFFEAAAAGNGELAVEFQVVSAPYMEALVSDINSGVYEPLLKG